MLIVPSPEFSTGTTPKSAVPASTSWNTSSMSPSAAVHGMAEMLEHRLLGERAFGPEVADLQRLLLREARGHDLAEHVHELFVAERAFVAIDDHAQHLRLALGPVVVGCERRAPLACRPAARTARARRSAPGSARRSRRSARASRASATSPAGSRCFGLLPARRLRRFDWLSCCAHGRPRISAWRRLHASLSAARAPRMPSICRECAPASSRRRRRRRSACTADRRATRCAVGDVDVLRRERVRDLADHVRHVLFAIAGACGRVRGSAFRGSSPSGGCCRARGSRAALSATMTAQFSSASPVDAPRCGSAITRVILAARRVGKSLT